MLFNVCGVIHYFTQLEAEHSGRPENVMHKRTTNQSQLTKQAQHIMYRTRASRKGGIWGYKMNGAAKPREKSGISGGRGPGWGGGGGVILRAGNLKPLSRKSWGL